MRSLAAEHLLPGEGDDIELGPVEMLREGGRGGVADRQTLAIRRNEVAIGHAHARRGAVPGEDDIAVEIDALQVRKRPIGCLDDADIRQFQLLLDVGDPGLAEAFPGDHVDAACAQQRPHRHFHRAGVGGRHDADAVIGRHLQDLAGEVDGRLQFRLADGGAMRAAERRVGEGGGRPARALGAGAGGKIRIGRPHNRLCHRRHLARPLETRTVPMRHGVGGQERLLTPPRRDRARAARRRRRCPQRPPPAGCRPPRPSRGSVARSLTGG